MKLDSLIKDLRKKNDTTSMADSPIGNISDWLSTGVYSLNRVITGDIHKGVPQGRITTFYGPSGSGKSLAATQIAKSALESNQVDRVWVFDSEGGIRALFENFGIDMTKVEYIPVSDIEECTIKMINVYDTLVQAREDYIKDPDANDNIRGLVILDSFGGLGSGKVISDATDKGKMVADMGESARKRNALMRSIMMRVVKANAGLIVVAHSYDDPAAMFASKIKNMSGGHGIEYASHIIVQCQKLLIKSDNNDFLIGNEHDDTDIGTYKGNRMSFFVVKSRVTKPAYQASVFVDFEHGIAKYDGLIEDCVKYGYIQDVRGGYIVPSYSDKRVTYRELISNGAIWDTFIDKFNNESIEKMRYSSGIVDEIKKAESLITDLPTID